MHIVRVNGGLGNQLFQYIFFLWLQERTDDICLVDDSFFFGDNVPHNGLEIERIFRHKMPKLSEYFEPEVWQYFIEQTKQGLNLSEVFRREGFPLLVAVEKNQPFDGFQGQMRTFWQKDNPVSFEEAENVYYYGFWLSNAYFDQLSQAAKQKLTFPLLTGENARIASQMKQCANPVAIHVRRGDMVALGWTAPAHYYKNVITCFEEQMDVDRYFLFSDDLTWCREHSAELGLDMINDKLMVVDINRGQNSYRDMQLMSLCHHRISDRSSFSLLAGWLCQYPDAMEIHNWGRKLY